MNWNDPTFLRSTSAFIQWIVIAFASVAVALQTAKHFVDLREKNISSKISAAKEDALAAENRLKSERIAKAEENQRELEAQLAKTNTETGNKLAEDEARLAETRKAADAANERAAILERHKELTAPRRFTEAERIALIAHLMECPKGKIVLTVTEGDLEAVAYSEAIRSIFKEAGHDVEFTPIIFGSGPKGIAVSLIMEASEDDTPTHALPILTSFQKAGIEVSGYRIKNLHDDVLHITVGAKPIQK